MPRVAHGQHPAGGGHGADQPAVGPEHGVEVHRRPAAARPRAQRPEQRVARAGTQGRGVGREPRERDGPAVARRDDERAELADGPPGEAVDARGVSPGDGAR